MQFRPFSKVTAFIMAIAALTLFGCGNSDAQPGLRSIESSDENSAKTARSSYETEFDMALGDPDAPVTLIEYASFTCAHCEVFHKKIYPTLKKDYIDTGKVRFVFRQFPTPPAQLAAAGEKIARCAGNDKKYFAVVDAMFAKQAELFYLLRNRGDIKKFFMSIGSVAGMTEAEVMKCFEDRNLDQQLRQSIEHGMKTYNIGSTPSLVINGELFDGKTDNADAIAAAIDSAME